MMVAKKISQKACRGVCKESGEKAVMGAMSCHSRSRLCSKRYQLKPKVNVVSEVGTDLDKMRPRTGGGLPQDTWAFDRKISNSDDLICRGTTVRQTVRRRAERVW